MIILKIYGLGEIALQISNVWLKSPKLGVQSEFMWLFVNFMFLEVRSNPRKLVSYRLKLLYV